jgi:hypothetical protein
MRRSCPPAVGCDWRDTCRPRNSATAVGPQGGFDVLATSCIAKWRLTGKLSTPGTQCKAPIARRLTTAKRAAVRLNTQLVKPRQLVTQLGRGKQHHQPWIRGPLRDRFTASARRCTGIPSLSMPRRDARQELAQRSARSASRLSWLMKTRRPLADIIGSPTAACSASPSVIVASLTCYERARSR